MWSRQFMGFDLYHIAIWFIMYSVIGWALESAYMSWCNRKLTNRGFNKGPFCPIYGFGFLGAYLLMRPIAGRLLLLYLAGAVAGTAFEFLVAVVMQRFLGEVWWDYNAKPFNYKGVICLESTIAWGFYAVCLFGFLQNIVADTSSMIPRNMGIRFCEIVFVVFVLDFSVQLTRALKISNIERFKKVKEKYVKLKARFY